MGNSKPWIIDTGCALQLFGGCLDKLEEMATGVRVKWFLTAIPFESLKDRHSFFRLALKSTKGPGKSFFRTHRQPRVQIGWNLLLD